jgi:hypothetical protein
VVRGSRRNGRGRGIAVPRPLSRVLQVPIRSDDEVTPQSLADSSRPLWKVLGTDRAPTYGGAKVKTNISRINLNVPLSLHEAVTERASREFISTSDYVRRALLAQLRRDGIELEAAAPRLRT